MHTLPRLALTICLIPCFFAGDRLLAQGPLVPGAAPAPTMKRLDEVEPRVNLQPTSGTLPTGISTDASNHLIISQPGSYYLRANLAATKTNAIQVASSVVTIELRGFEISRASGSNGAGILVVAVSERATLKTGWSAVSARAWTRRTVPITLSTSLRPPPPATGSRR